MEMDKLVSCPQNGYSLVREIINVLTGKRNDTINLLKCINLQLEILFYFHMTFLVKYKFLSIQNTSRFAPLITFPFIDFIFSTKYLLNTFVLGRKMQIDMMRISFSLVILTSLNLSPHTH